MDRRAVGPARHDDRVILALPPALESLPAGYQLVAGCGHATLRASLDWETYSEAGFVWDDETNKWTRPEGAPQNKIGLEVVGTAVYTAHPTADILSCSYNLRDGRGVRRWRPGMPPPLDLWAFIEGGGLLEAHKADFENWVWVNIAVPRYGWPYINPRQWRCSMAKARAHALPGALAKLGEVLNIPTKKDADGIRLLKKFSVPRNPTKTDPRRRIRPDEDPADAEKLYGYNDTDVVAEEGASARVPDLIPEEQEFWHCDQAINFRGVGVDLPAVENCVAILQQLFARYNTELAILTEGAVHKSSQTERLKKWLIPLGVYMQSMDDEAVTETLARGAALDARAKRALEIRQLTGSASVKKLYAMRNHATDRARLHDLFVFHAGRTGRAGGADVQPQNMPKGGPDLFGPSKDKDAFKCCGRYFGAHTFICPWCHTIWPPTAKKLEWTAAAIEDALEVIGTRSLDCVQMFFGDAATLIIGCLRGLFVAAPGHDLMASDYSAIEAVALAVIAGEEWRLEVFRTHGKIYETSASRVSGVPMEEFAAYRERTGQHRPERQKIGKCLELACGYGGWIGGTKAPNIAMDKYFSDDEIKRHILAWRDASPWIVELWGGQHRGRPWQDHYRAEYFGLEGMAIQAVLNPGTRFTYKAPHDLSPPITYFMRGDALYCELPSGRLLTYHSPRLRQSDRNADELALSFWGWNTNPKMGAIGWVQMDTYGGKLTENVVQATCRDILRDAIIKLERMGYRVVLHVHDEIVVEILQGHGSIEELEAVMVQFNAWCAGWPIRAVGGWRGRRYRKD